MGTHFRPSSEGGMDTMKFKVSLFWFIIGLNIMLIIGLVWKVYRTRTEGVAMVPAGFSLPSKPTKGILVNRRASRRDWQEVEQCRKQLAQLLEAIKKYTRDHNGRFPAFLTTDETVSINSPLFDPDVGLYPRYIADRSLLVCPAALEGDMLEGRSLPQSYLYSLEYADLRYWRLLKKFVLNQLPPEKIPVLTCRAHPSEPRPLGSIGLCIFLDGTIKWATSEDIADFNRQLTKCQNINGQFTSTCLAKFGVYQPEWTKPNPFNKQLGKKCREVVEGILRQYGVD